MSAGSRRLLKKSVSFKKSGNEALLVGEFDCMLIMLF
jgi:hypothetical protein